MKHIFLLIIVSFTLVVGCGDDGGQHPNPIVSADLGDADGLADMSPDVGMDLGVPDMVDMDGPTPTVIVDPSEAAVQPARSVILEASYFDIEGNEVAETEFAWSSENETIATVDEFGGVLGVAAGYVDIIAAATSDGTEGRALVNVHSPNTTVAAGRAHTCTSKGDGRVTCWGDTSLDQLGQPGMNVPANSPIRMDFFQDAIIKGIAAGNDHTCAYDADGKAHCWGRNHQGQLGNGTTNNSPVPIPQNFGSPVVALVLGGNFSCAHVEAGSLRCWGENNGRVLADSPAATNRLDPVTVHGDRTWTKVVAGSSHICGLDSDEVWCWGSNDNSQLGPNATGTTHSPIQMPGTYFDLWASHNLTCAQTFTDTLECWGSSPAGLGDGVTFESANPVEVALPTGGITTAAIGANHVCAVATNQTYCWGLNDRGQIGDDTLDTRQAPVSVVNGNGFVQLSLGDKHSCGRSQRGDVFCWGSNVLGQVGDGTANDRRVATYVLPTGN